MTLNFTLWIRHISIWSSPIFPFFCSILGAFVLAYGLWVKSSRTQVAGYLVFIISAIGGGIAYFTGEAAEETVERIAGLSEAPIEQHEEFATIALVSLIVLGIASLIAVFLSTKKYATQRVVAIVILLISLVSFGLVARTGYLGGKIRHTEISSGLVSPQQEIELEDD